VFRCPYRAFLFYKYFYANEKPLIVTEGKTDIRYIRAALKKMWDRYPELIVKKANGKFEFKVAFLHRTKKLEHFLKIAPDGANTSFIGGVIHEKPRIIFSINPPSSNGGFFHIRMKKCLALPRC